MSHPQDPLAELPADTREHALALLVHHLSTHHTGKGKGISAWELAARLHMSERLVRALVSTARMGGLPISATPSTGYYVAATGDELQESIDFLRSRAMNSLVLARQLRRIPMPALQGQQTLPT